MEKKSISECVGISDDLIIMKACSLAMKARTSQSQPFLLEKPIISSYAIFAFTGSWSIDNWYSQNSFGVSKIDLNLFPSLRSIGNDETAFVNESFLKHFMIILTNSQLREKVKKDHLIIFLYFSFRNYNC